MAAPQGVTFGSGVRLNRGGDLTGVVNGKLFTGSFWFRKSSGIGYIYTGGAVQVYVRMDNSGTLTIFGRSASSGFILFMSTVGTYGDNQWHHCCFSIDMANSSGSTIYVDDVKDTFVDTVSNDDVAFSQPEHLIGNRDGFANQWVGDLADLYLNEAAYFDLDTESNRRKFVGANAASSVDLGDTGINPTGSQPIMYFARATASWHTNKGSGGGFTETGALVDASTNPPDYAVPPQTATGVLVAGEATAAGVATKSQPVADGVLVADAATVAGSSTVLIPKLADGSLAAQPATAAGAAIRNSIANGILQAQAAAVAGDATKLSRWPANGVLVAQAATVAGVATNLESWIANGSLAAQEASVAGIATLKRAAVGALLAQAATVQGQAVLRHFSAGELAAQAATIKSRATAGDGWNAVDTGGNETWQ